MRAAALESELASARALLETGGVVVTYGRDGAALTAEVETALAMIVRESVTNIQRHAGARHARIEVMLEENASGGGGSAVVRRVLLRVSDDGRGGITAQGNGLAGIHERVRSLGGTLELDSPHGGGTVLRVRIPLAAPASVAAVERVGAAASVRATESEQGTGVLEASPVACVRGAPIGRLAPQAKAFESGGSAETGLGLTPDGVRK
jgi:two-component system sensor histidine kinase DesK